MATDQGIQGKDLRYREREWLYKQYITNELSSRNIAQKCNCEKSTILRWLKKFKIKRRSQSEALHIYNHSDKQTYINKDWLYNQYINLKLSASQIANKCNVHEQTIFHWLNAHKIPRRSASEKLKLSYQQGIKTKIRLSGSQHPNWKGGKQKGEYIRIYNSKHPRANRNYIPEHILIMEKEIGRYLWKFEKVHHINEIKTDNRIENLYLCKNNRHHTKIHKQLEKTAIQLLRSNKFGKIKFNKEKGKYYIEYLNGEK